MLQEHEITAKKLADYRVVRRPRDVFQFIEKYGKVIVSTTLSLINSFSATL